MDKKYALVWIAMCLTAIVACRKLDGLQPEILAPLAKTSAKVEDIAQIRDKHFQQTILAAEIGNFPVGVLIDTVPPIAIDHIGPYSYSLSDTITFVDIDTAIFRITFNNTYPITVQAGTQIVFRSSADVSSTSNIIFAHTISHDIPQNSSYSIDTIILNKYLPSLFYMSLDSFRSSGGYNVTFSSQPVEIDFDIRLLSTYTVGIKTNVSLGIRDTADVQISNSGSNYDSTASGIVSLYLTNSLPVNLHLQLDFYDNNYNYLTSLYQGNMYIGGGTTDSQGNPVGSNVEQRFDDTINVTRIGQLRSAAHVIYSVYGDTNGYQGTEVVAGKNCALNIQITGDLKIQLSKFF